MIKAEARRPRGAVMTQAKMHLCPRCLQAAGQGDATVAANVANAEEALEKEWKRTPAD